MKDGLMPLIPVHGHGAVPMGPLGEGGSFYPTKIKMIKIVKVAEDEDIPLIIREALVGLEVRSCFTINQISADLEAKHPGARLAYPRDVAHCLKQVGKEEALQTLAAMNLGELDMIVIEREAFEELEIAKV